MIAETVQTIELHLTRANTTHKELMRFVDTLSVADLSDDEKVKTIDAFLFRFIKIQDLIGNKLFRQVLDRIGEYQDSMSMLDVLDRMEKLGLIVSADQWMDYRNLRNVLAHEYPDNEDDIVEGIKTSIQVFVAMESCFRHVIAYMRERELIP